MKIYLLQEDYGEWPPFSEDWNECHDVIFVGSLEMVIEKRDKLIAESIEMADLYANRREKDDYLILVADTESGEVKEYKERR